jgi:hypothetical protein
MGYKALIKKQVKNAFNTAGDLAIDVTLLQKANTTFDFNSQEASTSAPVSKTVKAFLSFKGRDKSETPTNTIKGSLTFISEDVSDASIYATAKIDGDTWTLVKPYKDNGFTTRIEITREA